MYATLLEFETGLANLKRFLDGLQLESRLLSHLAGSRSTPQDAIVSNFCAHFADSVGSKRRFDYNSVIVSLYGYWEQFIEGLARSYVGYLSRMVPRYVDLPQCITKNHAGLSFELLRRAEHSKYKGSITEASVISNLHSCLRDDERYLINVEAFTHHGANFRSEVVASVLARIGAEGVLNRVVDHPSLIQYAAAKYPDEEPKTAVPREVERIVDDLAERRNEVAHGTASQLLSLELLDDYIDFFAAIGPALTHEVWISSLPHVLPYSGVNLGKPLSVYNNHIVCVSFESGTVHQNDYLIAERPDGTYRAGPIQEIQVDHSTHATVTGRAGLKIGMQVDFHANRNQIFYLLARSIAH